MPLSRLNFGTSVPMVQQQPSVSLLTKPVFGQLRSEKPDGFNAVAQPQLKVIQFAGTTSSNQKKNGLWITVERSPVQTGGLGVVSRTIPRALNTSKNKLDVRVLMPYLAPLKDKGYTDTGLSVKLKDHQGKKHPFTLMQKFEAESNTWVYAIANETYFGRYDTIYLPPKKNGYPTLGKDAMWTAVMMFNRASEALLPYLDGRKEPPGSVNLTPFKSQINFAIINDWLTSPFLVETEQDYPDIDTFFMFHNIYNELRPAKQARQHGLKIPKSEKKNPFYSPLKLGIKMADGVIINGNYARTITETDFVKGADYIPPLKSQMRKGRVFDMHHFIDNQYDPKTHLKLKTDGFVPLKNGVKGLESFKKTNKMAMQRMLGLNEDPDAIVYNWTSRYDPYQKGALLVMNEMKDLLKKNPKTQLVMSFGVSPKSKEPAVTKFINDLKSDTSLKGRIHLLEGYIDFSDVIRLQAGSDFMLMPSLYEPYGIVQLEAMKMGVIPLGHAVDGLRSTISDPSVNSEAHGPKEQVWEYGQTGVLMAPVKVRAYQKAVSKVAQGRGALSKKDKNVIKETQQAFRDALRRSLGLAKSPEMMADVRANGFQYVGQHHTPDAIVHRYLDLLGKTTAPSSI